MRLFLSSYRAGRHNDKLLEFLGDVREVGVISNAKDYKTPEGRAQRMQEFSDFFRSLGIDPTEIDLRPFFGDKKGSQEELEKHKFIWLAGGNAFLLRRALKYSGADEFIIQKVREDSLILGGESAGTIMTAPTLRGSEDETSPGHEDDPNYAPKPYQAEILWDGLDLLDYVLVPHYKSPDIGGSIDGYIEYLKKEKIPFKAIREEQALIVDGDKEEFLK